MLDSFLCLDRGIDLRSSGSLKECQPDSRIRYMVLQNIPAAAAASAGSLFGASGRGLSEALELSSRGLAIGLLLRRLSVFAAGGERERLSNLEVRFGSGSFWSNRERFEARLSVSSILAAVVLEMCASSMASWQAGCRPRNIGRRKKRLSV